MSTTLQPWICTYLIHAAEEYGGDLLMIPLETKNKRVQAIKFLTSHEVGSDSWIWAVVSDKNHCIPVRFSKQAVKAFENDAIFGGKSLSGYKTAIMNLKMFRPMFTRVPSGKGTMNAHSQLALEVNEFTLLSGFGEDVYGRPREVGSNESIREWSEGLKSDGGGGNVLKLRKLERAKSSPSAHEKVEDKRKHAVPPFARKKMTVANVTAAGDFQTHSTESPNAGPSTSHVQPKQNRVRSRKAWLRQWTTDASMRVFGEAPNLLSAEYPIPNIVLKNQGALRDTNEAPTKELPKQQTQPARTKNNALDFSSPTPPSSRPPSGNATPLPVTPRRSSSAGSDPEDGMGRPTTPSQWSPSLAGSQPLAASSPIAHDTGEAEHYDVQDSDDEAVPATISKADHGHPPVSEQRAPDHEQSFEGRSWRSRARSAVPSGSNQSSERPQVGEADELPRTRLTFASRKLAADINDEVFETNMRAVETQSLSDDNNEAQDRRRQSQSLPPSSFCSFTAAQLPSSLDARAQSLPPRVLAPDSDQPDNIPPSSLPLVLLSQATHNPVVVSQRPTRTGGKMQFGTFLDTSAGRILVPDSDVSHSQQDSQSQQRTQTDSQGSKPSLLGPQQSLSYTSASRSQSQSQSQSQPQTSVSPSKPNELEAVDQRQEQPGQLELLTNGVTSQAIQSLQDDQPLVGSSQVEPMDVEDDPDPITPDVGLAQIQDYVRGGDALQSAVPSRKALVESSVSESLSGEDSDSEVRYESVPGEDDDHQIDSVDVDQLVEDASEDRINSPENGSEEESQLDSDDERIQAKLNGEDASTSIEVLGLQKPQRRALHDESMRDSTKPVPVQEVSEGPVGSAIGRSRPTTPLPAAISISVSKDTYDSQTNRAGPSENARDTPQPIMTSTFRPGSHDSEAWKQPSFMRMPIRDVKGKRRASPVLPEDERPRKRVRHVSPDMAMKRLPHNGEAQHMLSRATRSEDSILLNESLVSRSGRLQAQAIPQRKIKEIDLSRPGSASSSSARSVERTLQTAVFSDADSGQSRSSSTDRRHGVRGEQVAPTTTAQLSRTRRQVDTRSAAAPSCARVVAGHSTKDAKTSEDTVASSTRDGTRELQPKAQGKLGGVRLDLALVPEANGPPFVTWTMLTDILLRTGRARHKEEQQKRRNKQS